MTRRERSTVIILICSVCLPQLSLGLYTPSMPYLLHYFHTSESILQLTLSLYMVGYALSNLIAGILSDHYGRKLVICAGLILYLFASILCFLSSSVWMLILGRFFQALGGCCGTVIARVIAKEMFNTTTQFRVLTYLSTGIAVTPALAPMLGGELQDVYGWRISFCVVIGVSFFLLVSIVLIIPNTFAFTSRNTPNIKNLIHNYAELLSSRHFLKYSCTISLAWCSYFTFTSTSTYVFSAVFGVNALKYGLMFAIVVLGYIAGTTLMRRYAAKVGITKMLHMCIIVALSSACLMVTCTAIFRGSVWAIVIPMMFVMTGIGPVFPCCQMIVLRPYKSVVGTASGLFFFTQMIAGAFDGEIMGFLSPSTQFPMVISVLVFCVILFIIYNGFIYQEKRKSVDSTVTL